MNALCRYRRYAGLSQKEAAQKIGVSRTTLSRWENGIIPSQKMMQKIFDTYGMHKYEQYRTILNLYHLEDMSFHRLDLSYIGPDDLRMEEREVQAQLLLCAMCRGDKEWIHNCKATRKFRARYCFAEMYRQPKGGDQ